MRKTGILIVILCFVGLSAVANDTIRIPLTMSVFTRMPQDGPTGSTPDPTDPNQFRASLTGNTLLIETQENAVSYVVIQEKSSDEQGEDYFYGISFGSISCPITRTGEYTIRIGYWKTDFTGHLRVGQMALVDINGHYWGANLDHRNDLPQGLYIFLLKTNLGTTTTKFYHRP
jgi:hypothetical protein